MKTHKKHKKQRIKTSGYGTSDIAALCLVTPATVAKWIDDGKIDAYVTPGGHRRVNGADLISFMRQSNLPMPAELESEHSLRVLLVDDDAGDRAHMAFLIRKNFRGVTVLEAENGFEMGHKVATFRPAFVLLDLMMPGMDGFAACEMIRKDPNLNRTKVIAVSGRDDRAAREKILALGADGFLSKNLEDQDFAEKLKELLSLGGFHGNGATRTSRQAVGS